jgi:hypothetical protein
VGQLPIVQLTWTQNISQLEHEKQKPGEEQIHNEDDQGGHNECGDRSAADARCPAFDTQALIAAHGRDDKSKNNWL